MAEIENRKSLPMLPIAHWWTLRKKFRQSIPGIVTNSYLATVLDMGAESARANVLPFLKTLGIIDPEGKPTERANLWRDDGHYADVCKDILKEVYPQELLDAVPDPVAERVQAERWIAQHTGTGQAAVHRMSALYGLLVESDPSKETAPDKNSSSKKPKKKSAVEELRKGNAAQIAEQGTTRTVDPTASSGNAKNIAKHGPEVPEININLQIHISADSSPDQIDQIFASMSKHIYGRS
jgi:hypothetical protein